MIVVTTGYPYIDIDAYAGCIAYAELLKLQGKDAVAASSSPMGSNIPSFLRDKKPIASSHGLPPGNEYVLIDISAEEYFDKATLTGKIVEIIDHHPGYEEYWKKKLGNSAHIEQIGAASTLVFERWLKAGLADKMDESTARLLMAGILDNSLNFQAMITKQRDKDAYSYLKKIAGVGGEFRQKYFMACEMEIKKNIESAIKNDIKELTITDKIPRYTAQMVVWEANGFFKDFQPELVAVLSSLSNDWAINLVSMSDQKSYIAANKGLSQQKLSNVLGLKFSGYIASPINMTLRKEILALALDS